MRKLAILPLLAILLMLFVRPVAAQDHEIRVTLERTACFGACPVYTITIYDDGTVIYNGDRFVEVTGEQTINIGAPAVEKLVDLFVESGYFDWQDEYTAYNVTDLPSVITSVTRDGETKQIQRYDGDDSAPVALPYLENWIDELVESQQWTGKAPQPPYFSSAGPVVISLERGVCYGTCPVYKLFFHEDGTAVYMGMDNVTETGIHITSISADEVASLARQMEQLGYFSWQDEYTDQSVSDAPTTITTLNWDGQYKRIEHYHGDRGAPARLSRIEGAIARAVDISDWIKTPPRTAASR